MMEIKLCYNYDIKWGEIYYRKVEDAVDLHYSDSGMVEYHPTNGFGHSDR
jgi:hypothetical protein